MRLKCVRVSVCVCASTHYFSFSSSSFFILDSTCSFSHCLTFSCSFSLSHLYLFRIFSLMKITLNSTMISTLNCEYTTANNVYMVQFNVFFSPSLLVKRIYMHARNGCVCVCAYSVQNVPTMDKINCIRDSIQMVISNKEIV